MSGFKLPSGFWDGLFLVGVYFLGVWILLTGYEPPKRKR